MPMIVSVTLLALLILPTVQMPVPELYVPCEALEETKVYPDGN